MTRTASLLKMAMRASFKRCWRLLGHDFSR
jgi:hypothetical protein